MIYLVLSSLSSASGNKQCLQILPYLYISQLKGIKTNKLVILKKYLLNMYEYFIIHIRLVL